MAATERQEAHSGSNGGLRVRDRVVAAVYALLGAAAPARAAAGSVQPPGAAEPQGWQFGTSFLDYRESGRINVLEPEIDAQRTFDDTSKIDILATVDTISGATPLGTLPPTPTAANTITSPSGRATNPGVGVIPMSNMTDTRYAIGVSWEKPFEQRNTANLGASLSKESDFLSAGADIGFSRDFNQKNTTIFIGFSPEFDWVTANGGLPNSYYVPLTPGATANGYAMKRIFGGLAGITQTVSRRMVMQWNMAYAVESGYLNDPYKQISLFDPATGAPTGAIFERRPGSRVERSYYWLTKYNLRKKDVASFSLRLFNDSWNIKSQTVDFAYRWQARDNAWIEPHLRDYLQSEANFYRVGLPNNARFPDTASSDLRLTGFEGFTIGVKVGWTFHNESELVVRLEYYTQTGNHYRPDAPGLQKTYDLFPVLDASIFQIAYNFDPSKLIGSRSLGWFR